MTAEFKTDAMPVELIEWLDSNMTTRWDSKEDYYTAARVSLACRSVGWVMHESDDRVCFTAKRSGELLLGHD